MGQSSVGATTFGSGIAANAEIIFLAGRGGRGPFYRVNRTTGVSTQVTFLNWISNAGIGALSFAPDGVLFGVGLPPGVGSLSILITLNPLTGHVTEIGQTVPFLDAIAFDPPTFPPDPTPTVPTLSDVAFLVMAVLLTGIALYRMRRRGARVRG